MTAPTEDRGSALDDLVADCLARLESEGEAGVEKLLRQHPDVAATVRERLARLRSLGLAGDPARPGRIGPYRILDVLGEGGMGIVYVAEQQQPVKRRVALKLIKLGMDSKAVVARFEQERQALALMQHDGIAKVHDCGTSDRGQPFFVMELVKGVPLTDYCDRHRLPLPARIELMQQVCDAVQHAHQKGVVHRDLKPGNVLVAEEAGKPRIKIIDFGLAKAMGQKLVEATLFTEAGQVVGTPEYMAPEQADPSNQDIDTRVDVYSLGVMLYEVLTGQLPFAANDLRKAGMLEMQRVLREVEPPKPSTKLTSVGESATAIAEQRRTSATALAKALKNDLDWLVLKALEKDRARRYETANALKMDLQRYLAHEPLVAGPPSAAYRLKKLLRRYRGQVVAGSLVLLALIGGGIGTFLQYRVARANETLATQRAEENAKLAQEKGALAASETKAKEQFAGKVREYDQLSAVVLLERAIANEAALWPAWPDKVEAMQRWLAGDARRLLAMRADIDQTVEDLQARALPPTAEDLDRDRRSHPRLAEFETARRHLASLRHAQTVRDGRKALTEPTLTTAQRELDVQVLNTLAWERVAPDAAQRSVWGEEELGLALARLAARKATATDAEYSVLDTLAWALLANGQDVAAREASGRAYDLAPENQAQICEDRVQAIDAAIANAAARQQAAEAAVRTLDAIVAERRTFRFELESQQFLHDALVGLQEKIAVLAPKKVAMEQRLSWARQVRELTLAHPNAHHTWTAVRAAIAQNPKYSGRAIELRDDDVMGLVPIGENPVTHLWEFCELRSAWDGASDPRTIAIPRHRPDGSIQVTADTGIVLVLLPGGTFPMGAQAEDAAAANHDPDARPEELPPHAVTLAPFFLGRHEVTRTQWERLTSTRPFWFEAGSTYDLDTIPIGPTHPAEAMSWDDANLWMERNALCLPTEAQWEFACRAGAATPWSTGNRIEDLAGAANVHDLASAKSHPSWGTPAAFEDGFSSIAPVGSFRANAFGLHDMHGNVREWCRDWFDSYPGAPREGDGLRPGDAQLGFRVNRGGSLMNPAACARAAFRSKNAPGLLSSDLGVRAARPVRR